jgi:hypothetical protein
MAILSKRVRQADQVRNIWHVTPMPENTAVDLLKPEYWVHVQRYMRRGDRLEILAEDLSWYAEAVVLDTGAYGARIAFTVDPVHLANESKVEVSDEFEVKWAGMHAKWRVLRASDRTVLVENLATKDDALRWIVNHRKVLAA